MNYTTAPDASFNAHFYVPAETAFFSLGKLYTFFMILYIFLDVSSWKNSKLE